jgi:hypothetical protein
MKTDPPPGSSWRDHLAKAPTSKGGMRRSLMGTLVAVEIQAMPTVVLSHRSGRKSPPWKESESA